MATTPDTLTCEAAAEYGVAALDARTRQHMLGAELAAAAPALAVTVAQELDRLGWTNCQLTISDRRSGKRSYEVIRVTHGPWYQLRKPKFLAMVRVYSVCEHSLLYDPIAPDRTWDVHAPPVRDFPEYSNMFMTVQMANALELAQFCVDAKRLMRSVLSREQTDAALIADGLAAAEAALPSA
jgi:hypothetical protein